ECSIAQTWSPCFASSTSGFSCTASRFFFNATSECCSSETGRWCAATISSSAGSASWFSSSSTRCRCESIAGSFGFAKSKRRPTCASWLSCTAASRIPSGSSRASATEEMNDPTSNPSSLTRQGMDYGETSDVQEVHAAIQREKREPRVGLEPLSIWLVALYGLALLTGGFYLGGYSGNFSGDSLDIAYIPPKKAGPG